MRISPKLAEMLRAQEALELYSHRFYRQAAVELQRVGLPVQAERMLQQSDEERLHSELFIAELSKYSEEGENAADACQLMGLDAPPCLFANPMVLYEQALKHEQHVSRMIRKAFAAAREEKAVGLEQFLMHMLYEQAEEEASAEARHSAARQANGNWLLLETGHNPCR